MLLLCDKGLTPVAPIDHAVRWDYEQALNEMSTGSLVLPCADPIVSMIHVPGSFVHAWDGAEDLGYFCVAGIESDRHEPGGTITYKLQGAEATLLRSMLTGWHELGGTEMSTRQVMAYMLARQRTQRWTLGECAFTDYYQYNFNDTTVLESLLSLGEVLLDPYMFVFDSAASPWTLHLVRAPETAQRALVYRRSMTSITRSVDGQVITRLYGRGYGEGDNQLTIASVNGGLDYIEADAAVLNEHGDEWDGVHVDTRQTDPATLKAHMEAILAAGCRPQVTYEVDVIGLYRETGEPWDDVRVGDMVVVLDEMMERPVTVRCTRRRRSDVESDPGGIVLTLDNSRADTAEELSEIRDKIGIHELYSQGATNMYSMQISDNADETHPLVMRFYVPGNVLRINSCRICWQVERFRTYTTLAAAGGGSTRTSSSSGGATVTLPARTATTTASTGAPLRSDGESGSESGGLTYQNTKGKVTESADGSGSHTHNIEAHTHGMSHWHKVTASVPIPSMSFELEKHSHTVTIAEHTHPIEYGVYEGARAGSISIRVDGEAIPDDALGEDREVDVAAYLRKNDDGRVTRSAWHEIEFTPDGITRITADLFFQVFIQSRGAGDY